MRLFIAIQLPSAITLPASRLLPEDLPGLRRVKPENLHVTLAFLGWTPDERLPEVNATAVEAASQVGSFRLSFDRAGRFPDRGRPRVVWLGIGEGMASVERLGQAVAAGLRSRSVRFDDRPLSPHLTLARVLADASLAEARTVAAAIDALQVPDLFTETTAIAVMQSALSPKGARYTALTSVSLAPG